MNREQLDALLPQIEAKEKQEEAQRQGMKEKLALLYRACQVGLIPGTVPLKLAASPKLCVGVLE